MTEAEQGNLLENLADLPDEAVARIMETAEGRERDLAYQFERFHRENPGVYDLLVKMARDLKRQGLERAGIGMLWEVLRWRYLRKAKGHDGFKVNNNHRSRYARLIMAREPDLAGFFETRELKS